MDFEKFEQRILEQLQRSGTAEIEVGEWDYYRGLGISYSAKRKFNNGNEDIGYVTCTRTNSGFRFTIYGKAEEYD